MCQYEIEFEINKYMLIIVDRTRSTTKVVETWPGKKRNIYRQKNQLSKIGHQKKVLCGSKY